MPKPVIVIGTSNPGKIGEIKRYLNDLPVEWQSTNEHELGITIDENADSFEGNAAIKALAFAKATGKPVIAGDGGMEIRALNNWPGLRSRRLDSGKHHTDDELVEVIQTKIATIPVEKRQYRFVTAYVFALPDGTIATGRGEHTGELQWKLHTKIEPGFPFRRFWWIPKFGKYFYDLSPEEYNEINHNRIALDQLRPAIEAYLAKESHA